MTLADLKPGDQAKIERIGKIAALGGRLADMGMTRGAAVSVRRVAPLGDPIEIEVRGYNLTLRREEAQAVAVVKLQFERS